MVNAVLPAQNFPQRLTQVVNRSLRWLSFVLLLAVSACSSLSFSPVAEPEIAPLKLPDRQFELVDVATLAPTPDLLGMDEDMVAFVSRYTGELGSQRQRLQSLHRALSSAGIHDLQYDPFAEGTAAQAFHRGTVNCLSYANLFVAMAREAGLDANYQWVDVRPQWTRMKERVAVRLHVNVVIKLRGTEGYMADIDPLEPRDITGTHKISDRDAAALYHSNIAMDALAEEQLASAWAHAARAVQLSPEMAHLWVNLGAVYRLSGQHEDAEQSYLHALELSPRDRSAMTNLAILYGMQGRLLEQQQWQQQIAHYQKSNPYYHASLGDSSAEQEDWPSALKHYQKALVHGSDDSRLLYATGLIYYHLGDLEAASRLITQAIEHATLRREINSYQIQLEVVQRENLAGF